MVVSIQEYDQMTAYPGIGMGAGFTASIAQIDAVLAGKESP